MGRVFVRERDCAGELDIIFIGMGAKFTMALWEALGVRLDCHSSVRHMSARDGKESMIVRRLECGEHAISHIPPSLFKPPSYLQEASTTIVVLKPHPHIDPPLLPRPLHLVSPPVFLPSPLRINRLKPTSARRLQIPQMTSHQCTLVTPQPKFLRRAFVHLGRGLKGTKVSGAEDVRPGEGGVRGHVREEGVVAVTQRGGDEIFIELGETVGAVGPGVEEMPRPRNLQHLIVRPESLEALFLQQADERLVVVLVDGFGGFGGVVRAREVLVAVSPLLGESAPVGGGEEGGAQAYDGGERGGRGGEGGGGVGY